MWTAEDTAAPPSAPDDVKPKRGLPRAPTPAWVADAAKIYLSGASLYETAARVGHSVGSVRKWFARAGVKTRPRGRAYAGITIRVRQAVALHEKGFNLQEIGDAMEITRERVRQLLVKAGVYDRHGLRKTSAAIKNETLAREAIESGLSARKAAAKFGVHQQTLNNAARRMGLSFRETAKARTLERYRVVAEYYRDTPDTTIFKTAQHFGVSFRLVCDAMAAHGITDRRSRHAAPSNDGRDE